MWRRKKGSSNEGRRPIRPLRLPRDRVFWRETFTAYWYLFPAFLILGAFVFYPFFSAFRLSLFKWSSLNPPGAFIGLDNYRYIFAEMRLKGSRSC